MSSSIAIPMAPQSTLEVFCSTHQVPPGSVLKLVFATLLHQYFDLHEFTFAAEHIEADHKHTHDPTTRSQQVKYASELASTTSIRAAFHLGETGLLSDDDLAPLLVNHTTTATQNGGLHANRLTAGLIFANKPDPTAATLTCSLDSQHNGLGLAVYFDEVTWSAHVLYDIDLVSEFVATGFVDAFAAALQCVSSSPLDTLITSLDICGPHNQAIISKWNQYSICASNKLLHELVGRGFKHKPDAIAILSWDGQLSYSELDKRSSSLAAYLMETYDVKPGKKVALCFEKSLWAVVSMLAVLKAGAAYCCLDPSHPRARHESIIQTLGAPLILTSTLQQHRFDGHKILVPTVELASQERQYQPTDVQPSDTCIVAFTSGSTGTPKGIVHTHNSLVTGILSNATPQRLDREGVSTFQWSNFTFDVSMVEIYAPLIFGGRICIPSDEERVNNVEETMNRMAVNWAYFTPSFARLFEQYSIPSLQTLLMGGEVVTPDDINAWYNRVKVIHSYGPAESATFFLYEFNEPCSKIVPIGPAPNTYSWIVNPNNPELLSPLGAIGEMLYEGPGLLKEYLGMPEKTQAVLIDAPSWRRSLDAPAPTSKLYRSGDLVRYLPDGTMMYIGRKDTMVKVRGQKLEVGEVESVMRKSLGGLTQVAVDLVDLQGGGPKLVAFLQCSEGQGLNGNTNGAGSGASALDGKMKLISQLRSCLMDTLPEYMVPRIYIPLASLPTTPNGKLDRTKLKEHAQSLPMSELLKYSQSGPSEEVLTDIPQDDTIALEVSEILDKVLHRSESKGENALKGKNATLEDFGLDSLSLVSLARAVNDFYGLKIPIKTFRKVNLSVRDIADIVRSQDKVVSQSEEDARAAKVLQDIEELDKGLAGLCPDQYVSPKKIVHTGQNVVFLTGATGFLGSQILRQLLALPSVSKVIVLVRAKDASTALQRIVTAATTARWWSSKLTDRIEVWLGDLSRPGLGVSAEQWARLEGTCAEGSEAVTAIIHNGAVVNWSSSYERLRATNILSTVQILELALAGAGPLRHLTYVSGGEMHLAEGVVAKDPSRLSSADGYSQSKFASDVLVERCVARAPADRRVNMVKPGIIIGTATEGISNTDDYIWRLVAGACEAGAFVDGEQDAVVCLAGADHVARRIIDACLGSHTDGNSAPHAALRMMQGVPVRDFWRMVSEGTGITLQAMDFQDWLPVVVANVSRKGPLHLLWPVMEWVEQRKGRIGDARLATCKASSCVGHYLGPDLGPDKQAQVAECTQGKETRDETFQALRKSVDYLSSLGFLQGGTVLGSAGQDVFRRSAVSS
ncbi:non-ribosomal peptide synthetase [Seiridium cupressi]